MEARDAVLAFGPEEDFGAVAAEVEGILSKRGVSHETGDIYEEVTVPVSDEWGWVVLENTSARKETYTEQPSDPIWVCERSQRNL